MGSAVHDVDATFMQRDLCAAHYKFDLAYFFGGIAIQAGEITRRQALHFAFPSRVGHEFDLPRPSRKPGATREVGFVPAERAGANLEAAFPIRWRLAARRLLLN
jgi:hypothetical protein